MTDPSFLFRSSRSPLAGITNPPSPVPHLLGTNNVPSDGEAIAAAHSAISHLDASEIAHVEQDMDRLTQERPGEALQVYVNDHNALIPPVRRVPGEIWCNIFLYCLPSGVESPESEMTVSTPLLVFGPRNAPGLLLRICSDWTDIALSFTRLWSQINISSHEKFQPPLSVVETWLRRSKQGSLSVVIGSIPDQMSSQFQDLVRTVLEQSRRWRVARLTLPLHHAPIFSSLENNLPELEELHLEFNLYHAIPTGRISSFQNAPKLRRVTFHHLPLPFANIELLLARLTYFSHKRADGITDLYTLLQSAPDLLEVHWGLRYDPKFDSSLTIHHSRLRNFSIRAYRGEVGLHLDRFSLPSLRILSIEASGQFWSSPQLKCFFCLNCQMLESFELSTGDIKGSELVACLKELPSVSRLTLSPSAYRSISYRVVKELLEPLCHTTSGEDPVILPMLKTITIHCGDPDKCKIGRMFVDMVKSRWSIPTTFNGQDQPRLSTQEPDVSRIESASLRIHSLPGNDFSMDPEDLDHLRTLRTEGLVVQVSSSQPLKSSVTYL